MNDCMLQSMGCNSKFYVLYFETGEAWGQNARNHSFWLCNMRVTEDKMFVLFTKNIKFISWEFKVSPPMPTPPKK